MARRPVSKKQAPKRTTGEPHKAPNLHIAISQRIVGLHENSSRTKLDDVKLIIERLAHDAGTPMESKDNALLRGHLERATGLTITALAELMKQWPV